jgi:hydroxypyruvate isomerase
MGQNDLRPGQYKRIGRIAEKNPDRAERVAARMTTRSERKDRGKEIADQYSTTSDKKKKFAGQLAEVVGTRKMSSMSADQIQSASQAQQKMGRDVPLATTPQLKQK